MCTIMTQKERGRKWATQPAKPVMMRLSYLESGISKLLGLSLREIADQLQADGFPSPRRGSQWSHTAVIRILARADKAPNQSAATTLLVLPNPFFLRRRL